MAMNSSGAGIAPDSLRFVALTNTMTFIAVSLFRRGRPARPVSFSYRRRARLLEIDVARRRFLSTAARPGRLDESSMRSRWYTGVALAAGVTGCDPAPRAQPDAALEAPRQV